MGSDAIKAKLAAAGAVVYEFQNMSQGVQMLEAGRGDFLVDDKAVLFQALKSMYPDAANFFKFKFLDRQLGDPDSNYVLGSKKYGM